MSDPGTKRFNGHASAAQGSFHIYTPASDTHHLLHKSEFLFIVTGVVSSIKRGSLPVTELHYRDVGLNHSREHYRTDVK